MHEFTVGGRRAHANVTDAQVPAYLSDTVLAVLGLQDVDVAAISPAIAAKAQVAASCPGGVVICIDKFPAIYGASSLPAASNTTIGVITDGTAATLSHTVADLNNFAQYAGYPIPTVNIVNVGTPGTDTYLNEWNMDTQSALAAAGGNVKSIVLYNAAGHDYGSLNLAYDKAMSDGQAKVITASLAYCEVAAAETQGEGASAVADATFESAVAKNQTFVFASGDHGKYMCTAQSSDPAMAYPAASPYVMAIGGTTLSVTNGNTWAGESPWYCGSYSGCYGNGAPVISPNAKPVGTVTGSVVATDTGGSTGGYSVTEAAPAWQLASGVLGTATMRGVPDISLDGNFDTGAWVLMNGSWVQTGGTSLSAPLFAGFYARIQSAHNNTLPFPAAVLYLGASTHPNWFHPINGQAAWNTVNGFGSLQVANFATAFNSNSTILRIVDDLLLND